MLTVIRHAEAHIREMASRWHDSLPPEARAELHRIANELLAPLLREPARRSSSAQQ